MIRNLASPDAYLQALGRKQHRLAELIRQPRAGAVHTPREIAQQPLLWRHTARLMQQHAPALQRFLDKAGLYAAQHRPHLTLTGAGTSDYVGRSMADLLRLHFRTSCSSRPSTRITAIPPAFLAEDQPHILLHFARSGNSPESRAVFDMSLRHAPEQMRHLVITCNEEGALAGLARRHPEAAYLVVLHEACHDKGLAMTSSFSNMLVAGQALPHLHDPGLYVDQVDRLAEAGSYLIDTYADLIFDLADPATERVFYLGHGDLAGAAAESALKVQELTAGQIIAVGEDTLAFRHGPISGVDARSLVCFFLSEHACARQYELDVILQYQEAFRDLGARVVVVGAARPDAALLDNITFIAYDPHRQWDVPPFYQAGLAVLFGQLFGLFASYRKSLNIDDPSLGKALYSRVVQGVQIYDYDSNALMHMPE